MAGILHLPERRPVAAVVFSGPMTSVKEQSAGVYARALAEHGYAALAFDHRYFGKSGGEPRQFEDPRAKIADIRNAITALEGFEQTRGLPVAALGLCIGGGYMARAVAEERRIRAFAGVVGAYVDPAVIRTAFGDKFEPLLVRARAAEARWNETGQAETIPAVGPNGGDVGMGSREAYEYYGTRRAGPAYVNGMAVQSFAHTLPFDAIGAASLIRVPTLLVHAEKATFPDLARRFYAGLGGPKKQVWLAGPNQVDFYDNPALIRPAVAAVADHFREALA